jgi:CRISPR/Cas system-associated exonuclease Cas4 (RecB family)
MVSVTELHLCYLCPRLLFHHHKAQKLGKSGLKHIGYRSGHLQGTILHEILEQVHTDLAGKGNSELHAKLIEALLSSPHERGGKFHSLVLNHYVLKKAQKIKTSGIFPLQDALKIWEKELFSCVDRELEQRDASNKSSIIHIFQASKQALTCDIENERRLQIRGEPDAVFFDSVEKEYVIWEFKGMKNVHKERVLMQVALYAWLLKKMLGISSRATIFVFENENPIWHYDLDEINTKKEEITELFEIYYQVLDAVANHDMSFLPKAKDRSVCVQCPISCIYFP